MPAGCCMVWQLRRDFFAWQPDWDTSQLKNY
jgi:hypothetical protein